MVAMGNSDSRVNFRKAVLELTSRKSKVGLCGTLGAGFRLVRGVRGLSGDFVEILDFCVFLGSKLKKFFFLFCCLFSSNLCPIIIEKHGKTSVLCQ